MDLVRGAIMILMALDHTRDFFGIPGQSPTNLATASAPLFLTRWVTHFCAPGFCFLMGTGAFLAGSRRASADLTRFLFTRGLWLIFLELVVVRCFAYQFNVDYRITLLLVLWSLGWTLIVLAALHRLPVAAVGAIGAILIAGHNLFDGIRSAHPLWRILHAQGVVADVSGHVVFVAYPLVPWIGVGAMGYALGAIYQWPADRRQAFLLRAGVAVSVLFVLVRGINVYGDPRPWKHQATGLFTALSFLNTTKQPPSLDFLLMTLGPILLALYVAERWSAWPRLTIAFGRVPLFYFVLHFVLLHALAAAVCLVRYGSMHWMFESPDLANYPFTPPPGWGFSLPVVYALWVSVVVVTYPACRWFAGVKARRRDWWLGYL